MKPSSEYALIKSIFMNEQIQDLLTDDFTPKEWDIPESLIYLVPKDKDGVVMIIPRNGIEIEAHIAILPSAKHKAVYYGKQAIEWGFSTEYLKITVMVPFFNEQTYKFCKKLGFKDEGINTMSFMKHGKLQNQWILGLTKEDWLCHQ